MKYLVSLMIVCLVTLYANACPLVANVAYCPQYIQPSVIVQPQYVQPQILIAPTPQIQVVPQVQYASPEVCPQVVPSFTPNVGYGGVGFNGMGYNSFNSFSSYGVRSHGFSTFNTFGSHNSFVRERAIVHNGFVGNRGGFLGRGRLLNRAAVDVRVGGRGFNGAGVGVRVRIR